MFDVPSFMRAFQGNAAVFLPTSYKKLEVMLMAFYSLLQVFVSCVHLK